MQLTTRRSIEWQKFIGDTTLEADPTSAAAEEYVNSLWKRGNIYKAFSKDGDYTGWAIDRKNPAEIGGQWDETNDVFIFLNLFLLTH